MQRENKIAGSMWYSLSGVMMKLVSNENGVFNKAVNIMLVIVPLETIDAS